MKKGILTTVFFVLLPSVVFALQQNDKLWLAINTQRDLTNDKKWQWGLYSQFRFIKDSHPWQTTFIEGTLGYQFNTQQSFWLGYRWSAENPNNRFYQANRFIQQFIWKFKADQDYLHFTSRTRLEEIFRSNQDQIAVRLRQRLAMEIEACLLDRINPLFYDEVFFQLNDTVYTPHKLIGENRLFIGVNLLTSKTSWWEIGYMNQFQEKTPTSVNQISNILSFTYNF